MDQNAEINKHRQTDKAATTCLVHIQGENKYSTITVFFSFIQHTPPPLFSTFLKVPGCIKCNLQYYNLVKCAAPSLSRCKIHYQLQQPSGL